jgi:hypothetical protein
MKLPNISNILNLVKTVSLTKTQLIIIAVISAVIIGAVIFVAVYFTVGLTTSSSSPSVNQQLNPTSINGGGDIFAPPTVLTPGSINYGSVSYNPPFGMIPNVDVANDKNFTSYWISNPKQSIGRITNLFEAALIYWTPANHTSQPMLIFYTKTTSSSGVESFTPVSFDENPVYITRVPGQSKMINGVMMDMNIVKYVNDATLSNIYLIELFIKNYIVNETGQTTPSNTLLDNAYLPSKLILLTYTSLWQNPIDRTNIKQYVVPAYVYPSSTSRITTAGGKVGTNNQAYLNFASYIFNNSNISIFAAPQTEPTLYP